MPIDRDRERAKRRYAKRQASVQARAAHGRRNQQVAGVAIAVLVVTGGAVALTQRLEGSPAGAAASAASGTPSSAPASSPASTPAPTGKTYAKAPAKSLAQGATWTAKMATSAGQITLQLFGDKAPQTVSSFLFLSRDGFYDGTTCHRLTTQGIKVLQCGDPTGTGSGGPGYQYGIENAPADGSYPAGTLAMARAQDPGSNGSQFFMVYDDTKLPTEGGGYSIFGRVTAGLDVLRAIAARGTSDGTGDGAPKEKVTITRITVEKAS